MVLKFIKKNDIPQIAANFSINEIIIGKKFKW